MDRSAWPPFLGCLAGLAVLTTAVPGPVSWMSELLGVPAADAADAPVGSVADSALLLAAGLIVWTLLAWGVTVGVVAAFGCLPGAPGQLGRAMLGRIAPAAAGRLVAATLGVSLLAGTTACAAPVMAGSDVATGSTAAASSSLVATPGEPAPSSAAPEGPSIDIDWPLTSDTAPSGVADPSPTGGEPSESASGAADPVLTSAQPSTTAPSQPDVSVDHPDGDPPGSDAPGSGSPTDDTPADDTQTSHVGDTDTTAGESGGAPTTGGPETGATDTADVPSATIQLPDGGPVTVRPGDSLWSIAAAALPPSSTTADVDSAWRAWYLTNRQVIGDDPDVITPGQSLLPPTPDLEPSP